MGFRFQRRLKILPGITLNLSKSGVSASVGTRGAHVTVGHGKVRETVGLPGTGLSYSETQSTRVGEPDSHAAQAPQMPARGSTVRAFVVVVLAIIIAVTVWKIVRA